MYSGEPPPSLSPAAINNNSHNNQSSNKPQSAINPMITSDAQAPSIGSVRPYVVSQPGGGFYSNDQQPPSHSDIHRREGSQIGSLLTADHPQGVEPGMSLTRNNFKLFYPIAFQKENDDKK